MNKLIEFNVAGGSVVIESSDEATGSVVRGGATGLVVEKVGRSMEETLAVIQPVADAAFAACRAMASPPDTVEVEFGLKFDAKVGAVISLATQGNFLVKLAWTAK